MFIFNILWYTSIILVVCWIAEMLIHLFSSYFLYHFIVHLGRMFPTVGHLYIGLFSDEALFIEQYSKGNFWCQENFHGVNLTGIRTQALLEIFKQPIVVGLFNISYFYFVPIV